MDKVLEYWPIGLFAVVSYFIWTAIHELSHFFMAKKVLDGVKLRSLKLWPHFYEGSFRFGGVSYTYSDTVSPDDQAMISLAPRIAGGISLLALPLSGVLFPFGWEYLIWTVFWGAGVIDTIYGSIGRTPNSDTQRAARALNISVWGIRIPGFLFSFLSIYMWYTL